MRSAELLYLRLKAGQEKYIWLSWLPIKHTPNPCLPAHQCSRSKKAQQFRRRNSYCLRSRLNFAPVQEKQKLDPETGYFFLCCHSNIDVL